MKCGQATDHRALFVFKGHVVGADRNGFTFPGYHLAGAAAALAAVGNRFLQQAQVMGCFPSEDGGTGFSKYLPPVKPGDFLGFIVKKSDVAAAAHGEDADIKVVQDDLKAAFFIVDAVDQVRYR